MEPGWRLLPAILSQSCYSKLLADGHQRSALFPGSGGPLLWTISLGCEFLCHGDKLLSLSTESCPGHLQSCPGISFRWGKSFSGSFVWILQRPEKSDADSRGRGKICRRRSFLPRSLCSLRRNSERIMVCSLRRISLCHRLHQL